MKLYKIFILTFILLFVIGCTATLKMVPKSPLNTKLNKYHSVFLLVESNVTEDIEKELTDLRGLTASKIQSLNAFKRVQFASESDNYDEESLLIKVSIAKIRKVSKGAHFMLGVLAGRASMDVDITFIDALNNKIIGSYTATGYSGGMAYSGGTSDAVNKTAEAIKNVIKSKL